MTDVKRKALSRSRSVKSTVCARTLCAKGRSDNAAAPAEPLWGCAVYIRVCTVPLSVRVAPSPLSHVDRDESAGEGGESGALPLRRHLSVLSELVYTDHCEV